METVRVKIAIAVDDHGDWCAAARGFMGKSARDEVLAAAADGGLPFWRSSSGEKEMYWAYVDLPVPQRKVVALDGLVSA